jgi:hypothetical protein
MRLDHIIPKEILNIMNDDFFELEILFRADDCRQKWPMVRIFINESVVFDAPIIKTHKFYYSTQFQESNIRINIQYYGKQDSDTSVDSGGNIIQDQAVFLEQVIVNGIDIIKTNIIYSGIGQFKKELSAEKLQYYQSIGINTTVTRSTSMHDNGTWSMEFLAPVMSFLISKLNGETPITQAFEVESLIIDTYETAVKIQEGLL